MKKITVRILRAILGLIAVAILFLFTAWIFPPVGNVVFSIAGGNVYRRVDKITALIGGKQVPLTVYQAQGKPFLIVGPCRFQEGENYEDFFFVDRDRVIRTAVDKGGDIWCRVGGFLFILDDLSDHNRQLRAPIWDDLQSDPASCVRCDEAEHRYTYTFNPVRHRFPLPCRKSC